MIFTPADGRGFYGGTLTMWLLQWRRADGWETLSEHETRDEALRAQDEEAGGYPDSDCRVIHDPGRESDLPERLQP